MKEKFKMPEESRERWHKRYSEMWTNFIHPYNERMREVKISDILK